MCFALIVKLCCAQTKNNARKSDITGGDRDDPDFRQSTNGEVIAVEQDASFSGPLSAPRSTGCYDPVQLFILDRLLENLRAPFPLQPAATVVCAPSTSTAGVCLEFEVKVWCPLFIQEERFSVPIFDAGLSTMLSRPLLPVTALAADVVAFAG